MELKMVKAYSHMMTLLTAILFGQSHGRFPMICSRNVTEGIGVCCPVPNGFTQTCGGPGRGECGRFPEVQLNYHPRVDPIDMANDDRFNWPHRYVQVGCRCEGNFYGYDCSSCKYGYTGRDCTERETFTRRNFVSYTEEDKQNFIDTVMAAKTVLSGWGVIVHNTTESFDLVELSIWDLFEYSHFRAAHDILDNEQCRFIDYDFAHRGPGFLTWHRLYLLWIERELRMVSPDKSFALPYWDWVGADHCEVCTNDFLGEVLPDGTIHSDSRLSTWRAICNASDPCRCDPREDAGPLTRTLGATPGTRLPLVSEAEYTLTTNIYDAFPFSRQTSNSSFRLVLEGGPDGVTGMHNGVHDWIGGSMANVTSAANDPIFLLHHTFVDKVFEIWFRNNEPTSSKYPSSFGPAGHLARDPLIPFYPPEYNIDYFHLSSTFGYEYDTLRLSYEKGNAADGGWKLWHYVAISAAAGLAAILICVACCCACRGKPVTNTNQTRHHPRTKISIKKETNPLLPK